MARGFLGRREIRRLREDAEEAKLQAEAEVAADVLLLADGDAMFSESPTDENAANGRLSFSGSDERIELDQVDLDTFASSPAMMLAPLPTGEEDDNFGDDSLRFPAHMLQTPAAGLTKSAAPVSTSRRSSMLSAAIGMWNWMDSATNPNGVPPSTAGYHDMDRRTWAASMLTGCGNVPVLAYPTRPVCVAAGMVSVRRAASVSFACFFSSFCFAHVRFSLLLCMCPRWTSGSTHGRRC
jgi:hypothetical protein